MFTKQHYEAIANVIDECPVRWDTLISKETLVRELGLMFQRDNPLYNHTKFVTACYDKTK